jgi:curli biogenesis system outer membrane secretion channel CsgG
MLQPIFIILFSLFFLGIQLVYSQEITNEMMRNITNSIAHLCTVPDQRGKYWNLSITGGGNTIVKLFNIDGHATFSKGEWEGIKNVLSPEGQAPDRDSARKCVQTLAPLFMEKFVAHTPLPKSDGSPKESPYVGVPTSSAANLHDVVAVIPIFRNLTSSTEQISVPIETCAQVQASQPYMNVDRFSMDARNLLENALVTRAGIRVVKREQLAQAVCEMELGRSGLVNKKTAAKLGKLIGATIQVEGTIENIRVKKYTFKGYGVVSFRTTVTALLSINFISVETGALLFSTTLEGEEENISTSFGSMDNSDMIATAIKNAIDSFEKFHELKSKLAS